MHQIDCDGGHHRLHLRFEQAAVGRGEGDSCQQICLKLRTQCLHRCPPRGGEKTREGRTIGQTFAIKERHEDLYKWEKTCVAGIEGPFEASGIAQKHDDEINGVIRAETCKLHMGLDSFEQATIVNSLTVPKTEQKVEIQPNALANKPNWKSFFINSSTTCIKDKSNLHFLYTSIFILAVFYRTIMLRATYYFNRKNVID